MFVKTSDAQIVDIIDNEEEKQDNKKTQKAMNQALVDAAIKETVEKSKSKADWLMFAIGTKIMMADGSVKNIEDIKIGNEVITHHNGSSIVTEVFVKN